MIRKGVRLMGINEMIRVFEEMLDYGDELQIEFMS